MCTKLSKSALGEKRKEVVINQNDGGKFKYCRLSNKDTFYVAKIKITPR